MKKITVVLADDHSVVREGLNALLQAESDIRVVGQAETGVQAVKLVEELHPDVVVMDVAMPLLNGVEATRQIRQTAPETRVLILSAFSNPACIEQVLSRRRQCSSWPRRSGKCIRATDFSIRRSPLRPAPSLATRCRLRDATQRRLSI